MTASARAMRQMLWRDAANRLILEETAKAEVRSVEQIRSDALLISESCMAGTATEGCAFRSTRPEQGE